MKLRLRHLVFAALAAPPLAVLVAWLGIFNVGAASGHWAITDWFLHFAMRASVRTWALLDEEMPGPLQEDTVRTAAGHYATGCAWCHGAPGEPRSAAARAMLPAPPSLPSRIDAWTDDELFRIVKHGVRFTGMPAWPSQARDDEVRAMVAFLRALPGMTAEAYAGLTAAEAGALPGGCAGCHGADGARQDALVPRLAGQSAAYLRASMDAYAEGRRASGMMQQVAARLPDAERQEIADRLAALPGPARPAREVAAPDVVARGRPGADVPACLACHGEPPRNAAFPNLAGQPKDYLAGQLRRFRDGVRGGGPYVALMTRAARGLDDADIAAAAAWFSGQGQ